MTVLVLVASLRQGSDNARLATAAIAHLPAGIETRIWDHLADLPHYSEDLDRSATPEVVRDLRESVAGADGLLVVTPEYNGSLPGALKDAIDWLSRPRGEAAIAGTPTAAAGLTSSPATSTPPRSGRRRGDDPRRSHLRHCGALGAGMGG